MFVRFREYELVSGHKSLRCEIVENYRDKCSGKVRQRSISYLASVKEHWTKYPRVRAEFWRRVEDKLSCLPLSELEAQKVRSAIDRRIPREITPTSRLGITRKETAAVNSAPVPFHTPSSSAAQTPSSPAAEDTDPSAQELLSRLAAKLELDL